MPTEQQIPKLVGTLVEHQSAFQELSNDDAQWVITNTKEAISMLARAVKMRDTKAKRKVLKFLMTFNVKDGVNFVAKDNFSKAPSKQNIVKIVEFNPMFEEYFLSQVEEKWQSNANAELKVYEFVNITLQPDISAIQELGQGFHTTLFHLWSTFLHQYSGHPQKPLCTRNSNNFFVYSMKYSTLCIINVYWKSYEEKGWVIRAYPLGASNIHMEERVICREEYAFER